MLRNRSRLPLASLPSHYPAPTLWSHVRFGSKAGICSALACPLSARKQTSCRHRPLSAFTRPEATAAWSAAKSRSFWSAYVSANETIARSK